MMMHGEGRSARAWVWIASLCALSLGLGLGAYAYFRSEETRIQKDWYTEIAMVARLKVDQIQGWREERRADAERAVLNPFFSDAVALWLATRSAGAGGEVRVLADLRPIADTPWFMVAKVDESEILPEARYRAVVIWGAMSMVILLVVLAAAYGFGRRRAVVYKNLYAAERERREAQEELRAVSARQKALLAAVPDIVMEVDRDRVYRWANEAGIEFFGPDVIGTEASHYFVGEQKTYDVVEPLFEGSDMTFSVESWQRRKDGEKRLLSWTSRVLKDEHGEVMGALSSARDVTERVLAEERRTKLEEQLRQSRKMEAVGRLAGGVAHDFNNMLSVILGYSEMVLEDLPPAHPLYPAIKEVKGAARHSADLTRQLLAFARKQPIAPKVMDINTLIEQTRNMLRRLIGDDITLAFTPSAEGLTVRMDPSQMEQILTNLAANSRDSIQGVGSVRIETSMVFLDRAYCDEHLGTAPGQYVLITFSDSGRGMDKDTLERVFEPFFTTKGVGTGTGLGLATVYGIVAQNGGAINVYSEPDHGTTFKIYLPSAGEKPSGEEHAVSQASGGVETVLIVEDEEQILRMCRTFLENKGYTVLTAGRPLEALTIAGAHQGRIDLLVTDVIMSEMNGKDLQERIRAVKPEIRVIFMSGYTADIIASRGILEKDVRFLQKPFSPTELARKVREALDEA